MPAIITTYAEELLRSEPQFNPYELSKLNLLYKQNFELHPASQKAARNLRYATYSTVRDVSEDFNKNKNIFETQVDLQTPLDTGLSELARILFGPDVLEIFKTAHSNFSARDLFEFTSVPTQCKNTVGLPIEKISECWICGIPIDKTQYGMYNECEHVLPIAQASYFLALYGPQYINLKKTINTITKTTQKPDEELIKKKKLYDYIFSLEYDFSHAACNRLKNDMCGITGKLYINKEHKKIPFASINEISITQLLKDIFNNSSFLVNALNPLIRAKYKKPDIFIKARMPVFYNKYKLICQFLNQCSSFDGSKFIQDPNCLYKFNALCIAGAGSIIQNVEGRMAERLKKYTEMANAFIGDKKYIKLLGDIYTKYHEFFKYTYKTLQNICNTHGLDFKNIFNLPIIDIESSPFKTFTHEYFSIATSIPQFIYLENQHIIMSTKEKLDTYILELTNCLISVFLRERCMLIPSNDFFKSFTLDVRKAFDTQLISIFTTKEIGINLIKDITTTNMYSYIADNYYNRYKYKLDNIIILRFKKLPVENKVPNDVEGGGKFTQIHLRKKNITRKYMRQLPQTIHPKSLTLEELRDLNNRLRDERAAQRAALREKIYNNNMLVGISAIDTVNNTILIAPVDINQEVLIEDFNDIYTILNDEGNPIHSSLSEEVPIGAGNVPGEVPMGAEENVAEGGKRTAKRHGSRNNKRHIKTRKYKK